MKPISVAYTSTGAQPWVPLDHSKTPFAVSCFTAGGTAGTIEFTVDDLQDPSITPVAAGTVSGNYLPVPATGVRLNVLAAPITFKVLQAGR